MVHTPFFSSSKCSLFHNSNLFGSYIIHILYTRCAEIKKNNSGAKRLIYMELHPFSPPPPCFQDLHGDNFAVSSDKISSSLKVTFILGLKDDVDNVVRFMCTEYARFSCYESQVIHFCTAHCMLHSDQVSCGYLDGFRNWSKTKWKIINKIIK